MQNAKPCGIAETLIDLNQVHGALSNSRKSWRSRRLRSPSISPTCGMVSLRRGCVHPCPLRFHFLELRLEFFAREQLVDELARKDSSGLRVAREMHADDLTRMRDSAGIVEEDVGKHRRELAVEVG